MTFGRLSLIYILGKQMSPRSMHINFHKNLQAQDSNWAPTHFFSGLHLKADATILTKKLDTTLGYLISSKRLTTWLIRLAGLTFKYLNMLLLLVSELFLERHIILSTIIFTSSFPLNLTSLVSGVDSLKSSKCGVPDPSTYSVALNFHSLWMQMGVAGK